MHVIDIIVNDSAMYVFQFKKKNSLMFNQNVITWSSSENNFSSHLVFYSYTLPLFYN